MKKRVMTVVLLMALAAGAGDLQRAPTAAEARLDGAIGAKADRFLKERVFSDYARTTMFAEAERAFDTKFDDDPSHPNAGYWQGEYWGKQMLGLVEGAEYGHDEGLKTWCLERTRALIAKHQRADGYLSSYRDPELLEYPQRWNWNLWGRKYTLWAFLAVYRATGAKDVLAAAAKLMDQQIEMLHKKGIPIWRTGCYVGLPSMSVLKPLLILHRETKEPRYLDYAKEIVAGWRRGGDAAPDLLTNAFKDGPVADWYPQPHEWAKAYEFMSCLEGLVEYARVTDDGTVLEAVERIWEKLVRYEANPVGTVAYFDHFANAASIPSGGSEPCDSTHWIRVCRELYLLTGRARYLDWLERAFVNGFLAGVYRDGKWGAHMVRSHGTRHRAAPRQVGMNNTQCCVANIPRTFYDVATTAVTRGDDGSVSVNLFIDSTTRFDGGTVTVTGGYPFSSKVRASVDLPGRRKVRFRVPDWCQDFKVDGKLVLFLYSRVKGGWEEREIDGPRTFEIDFTTKPRVVHFDRVVRWPDQGWARWFFETPDENPEMKGMLRQEPGARVEYGPLLLAKAKLAGTTREATFAPETFNGRCTEAKLEPRPAQGVMGAWTLELDDGTRKLSVPVCDYPSAADFDDADNWFSIWF